MTGTHFLPMSTFLWIYFYLKSHLEVSTWSQSAQFKSYLDHCCQKPKRNYLTSTNLSCFLCWPRIRTGQRCVERINTVTKENSYCITLRLPPTDVHRLISLPLNKPLNDLSAIQSNLIQVLWRRHKNSHWWNLLQLHKIVKLWHCVKWGVYYLRASSTFSFCTGHSGVGSLHLTTFASQGRRGESSRVGTRCRKTETSAPPQEAPPTWRWTRKKPSYWKEIRVWIALSTI